MCGRYNIIPEGPAFYDFFQVVGTLDPKPRHNVAPSQAVPVVVHNEDHRKLKSYRWGLIPFWAKDQKIGYKMINARAETVAEKPLTVNNPITFIWRMENPLPLQDCGNTGRTRVTMFIHAPLLPQKQTRSWQPSITACL